VRWKKNIRNDYGGKTTEWAYAKSPLIDGYALVCAPGGSAATVIALRKGMGDLLWKCPVPEADDAGFSSAIVVEVGGIREYVRLLTKGLAGIEALTGRLLWHSSKPISKYGANITAVRVLRGVNAKKSNVDRPSVRAGGWDRLEVFMRFSPSRSFAKHLGCMPENDYEVKTFCCWSQFLCMAFGQLTFRESLRDVETCLRSRR